MTNADIARVFQEIADLLEIRGDSGFRINSYRRVARTISDQTTDLQRILERGELAKLPGVGKASAEKIEVLLQSGRLPLREQLREELPETLLDMLHIPGMGPKKVSLLFNERAISSLEALSEAIDAGQLEGLKGFGAKSIASIREGIDFLQRSAGRTRIGDAWPVAEHYRDLVVQIAHVERVEHAGSLRRGCETVGDLDLLCIAADGAAVVRSFTELPGVTKVLAAGGTKGSVLVELGTGHEIQIDLRVVSADSFGAAWQYFTGSKEHNVRLRERAVKRGWSLNEYALTDTKSNKIIASYTEQDIYKAFGVAWIPPELREDRGELDSKDAGSGLLQIEDLRGDLHMHTRASDGKNTIEEMAAAAKQRGYDYICITDHSQSSVIANGLKPDRLLQHIEDVRRVAKAASGIKVWVGSEVDILANGSLDYNDALLAQLDFVVASVHMGMGRDRDQNTKRVLAAIHNPHVNLIAHPTGRLINEREAMPLDMEAIATEAARTGTALEINANHHRLDLKDQHARLARDLGATICIDCDAHRTTQFDQMRYGVATARRAGLRTTDVLNTRSSEDIMAFVRTKRER